MSLVAVLVSMSAPTTIACNTPVYRYAMYNWAPSPYFVFYFHPGEPPAEDEKVNKMISELSQPGAKAANVILEPVDVSQGEVDRLPGPVKEAWESQVGEDADQAEPAYLVFTSWGAKLHVGRLDAATVRAMVDSPVRTRIGQLLGDGYMTVMVLLAGSDAKENERAEKVAQEVIAQAASGQIPVESAFLDADPSQWLPPGEVADDESSEEARDDDDDPPAANRLKIGLVKLTRSDAAEQWFVRSLTAMEPDLVELAEQPMIFFAYGRGRAMPPYVGKGITEENLTGEIQFLGSACSCFVKEQNPGADLLMHWDWEATADAMAANDPTMYGDPFAYQEFPAGGASGPVPSEKPEAVADASSAIAAASQPGVEGGSSPPGDAAQGSETSPPTETGAAAEEVEDVRPHESGETTAGEKPREYAGGIATGSREPDRGGSFAFRLVLIFGIGLVVATVLVICAGSVLTRRRAMPG